MQKKKKAWLMITGGLVLAAGLYATTYLPKKIVDVEPAEVSRIEIFDGNRGEPLTVTNEEQIDHIVSDLNSVVFQKEEFSLFRLGYNFRVTIHEREGDEYKEFIINSENSIRENGFTYETVSNGIDYAYIDQLFEENESE